MKSSLKRRILSVALTATVLAVSVPVTISTVTAANSKAEGYANSDATLKVVQTARYDSGQTNADGGVMEIVDYNTKTGWAYSVNGLSGNLTAIPIKTIEENETEIDLLDGYNIDVKSLFDHENFVYGDMTSVAVAPNGETLAVAVQADNYADNGYVVIFDCNDDGTLTYNSKYEVGVQPDMVKFTPDGTKILSANEGEPREGYTDAVDPMGTVSVITLTDGTASVETVDFTAYDSEEERQSLVDAGIVIMKGVNPSADFEPEYIATSNSTAYVTLQEANAVAVLDLNSNEFEGIYSVGFEDYSTTAIDIDKKDEIYSPETYESLKGIRMPDGISMYTVDGVDYIVTANEGDSREWGDYLNEDERNFGKGKTSPTGKITAENSGLSGKVVFFKTEDFDGLDSNTDYLFGGRSFTVFRADENGLEEVYTSASDFEEKTAQYIAKNFNCSNDDIAVDDRSGKKGPEAESVVIGQIADKTYAFVGLERIGGVMIYDITSPENAEFVNYINSRDFSAEIAGDDSPEGLCFVASETFGKAQLITACEVSGTVAVYNLEDVSVTEEPTEEPTTPEVPTEEPTQVEETTEPVTEESTVAPTESSTHTATTNTTENITSQSTTQPSTATSAQSAVKTQQSNNSSVTGKVATGDSTAVLILLIMLFSVSGTVVFCSRKKSYK